MSDTGASVEEEAAKRRFVFVTGPAGAGRSSALNVLEDAGFEAIDNLPLRLMPALLDGPGHDGPVALGIDTRNRDFSTDAVLDLIGQLSAQDDSSVELLYLDCVPDVLLRRYSETRRRHPMAPEDRPADGVANESCPQRPSDLRGQSPILHALRPVPLWMTGVEKEECGWGH